MRTLIDRISDRISRHETLFVVGMLLVGFIIRAAVAINAGIGYSLQGDDGSYNRYANAIMSGWEWLSNGQLEDTTRSVGWPLVMSVIYSVFGANNYMAIFLFNALVGVITCYLIYRLAALAFCEKSVAYLALIWSVFYMYYISYVPRLIREQLIMLLMVSSFYTLLRYFKNNEYRSLICFTVLFAFLCHVDPRYVFYYPFLIVLFITYQPGKYALKNYSILIVLSLLLFIPWNIRNYHAYDRFVFMDVRTFDSKVFIDNPIVKDGDHKSKFYNNNFWNMFRTKIDYTVKPEQHVSDGERLLIKSGENPNKRPAELIEAIKRDGFPASGFWARKWWFLKEYFRAFRFAGDFRPYPADKFVESWPIAKNIVVILSYGLLWPLFIWGMIRLYRKDKQVIIFIILPIFIQAFLHFLQWGLPRYRAPTDFLLIIGAMYGLNSVLFGAHRATEKG